MDKISKFIFLLVCISTLHSYCGSTNTNVENGFYSFTFNDIKGEKFDLSKYIGKVTLVVNVASQCSQTESQYKSLKRLHDILSFEGFSVLAFPSNDFGEQEPWDEPEIEEFVRNHFQAEFPLFGKISVIGEESHKGFKYLAETSGITPEWNFHKYLIDGKGQVIGNWDGKTSIESIFSAVKNAIDINNGKIVVAQTKTKKTEEKVQEKPKKSTEDKENKDEL